MYSKVKKILDSTLKRDVVLEIPKDSKKGDFATTAAFCIAKEKGINVKEAANEVISKLEKIEEFQKIEFENGFINITLHSKFITKIAKEILENKKTNIKNESILLEYVSANPTGPLHIGHARGAIIGDILNKIGKYLGYKITTEYYINDAGAQIKSLGKSIFLSAREILNMPIDSNERDYKGNYIIDLAKNAINKFGEEIFINEKEINAIAHFGMEQMMQSIKATLAKIDIYFDNFVSEKETYKNLDSILEKLNINNATYIKDSKLWLKSSQKGDEKDRVIIKDNKEATYLAGDIVYHYDKFHRKFNQYINIWGADHHGYINRIKASIDFLGFESKKLEVILPQMVSILKEGKPYKMSKRAGNFILMENVMDDIGAEALRFIFITKRLDTHLEFDIDIFAKEDASNPIYYINYANARIHTLLLKSSLKPEFDFTNIDSNCRELLMLALVFNRVIEDSFHTRALQKIPEYLKNLSSKLHQYYNSTKIIGAKNEAKILAVLVIVSFAITKCFDLIGIKAKTKM